MSRKRSQIGDSDYEDDSDSDTMGRKRKKIDFVEDDDDSEDPDGDAEFRGVDSDDESEEEGEMTPEENPRERFLDDDEEDSDDDDDSEMGDGYDSDLYAGEQDRRNLAKMSEIDRERIIADRAAERDKLEERKRVRKLMGKQRRRSKRGRGRDQNSSKALDKLKRKRMSRRRRDDISDSDDQGSSDDYGDSYGDDDDDEDDNEDHYGQRRDDDDGYRRGSARSYHRDRAVYDADQEEKRTPVRIHADTKCTLKSILSCQVRRDGIHQTFEEPYFEDWIQGAFVRVGLGINKHTQQGKYVMGEVVGLSKYPRKYKFFGKETDGVLCVAHAHSVKRIKFEMISNRSITEDEYSKWYQNMINGAKQYRENFETHHDDMSRSKLRECKLPTHEQCLQLKTKAEYLRRNFVHTNEVIKRMRDEAGDSRVKNYTIEVIRLNTAIREANDKNDYDTVHKLTQRMNAMKAKENEQSRKKQIRAHGTSRINARFRQLDNAREVRMSKQKPQRTDDAFKRSETRPRPMRFGKAAEIARKKFEEEKKKREEEEKRQKLAPIKTPSKAPKFDIEAFLSPRSPTTPNTPRSAASPGGTNRVKVKTHDPIHEELVRIHTSAMFNSEVLTNPEHVELPKEAPRVDQDWFYRREHFEKTMTLGEYLHRTGLIV